jgi:hypothetical protein
MTTNLTRAHRIAFQAPDINPVPGHHLVVFSKRGAGQEIRQVVAPGQRIKLRWGERMENFLAYAVPASPQLRHSFSRPYQHREQEHTCVLRFALEFAIRDPRRLVEEVDRDPLYLLEEETARLYGAALRQLPWQVIARESENLEGEVLRRERADFAGRVRSNLEALQGFAATLGFDLADVAISRTLPESAYAGSTKEVTTAQDWIANEAAHKLEVQATLHRAELARLETETNHSLTLRGTLAGAVNDLIRRLGSEVRSMQDVEQVLPRLEAVAERVRRLPAHGQEEGLDGQLPLSRPALIGRPDPRSNGNGLGGLTGAAIALRGGGPAERAARRRLVAALLHLLAEASLEEEASDERMAEESAAVRDQFQTLLPSLSDDEVGFIRHFQDVTALRAQLAAHEDAGDE